MTEDDFILHTHDSGRVQVVASPELTRAITKAQGNKYYQHSGLSQRSRAIEALGGTIDGVMSADERWSHGIVTSGSSSSADLANGSGDRVYLTGRIDTPHKGGQNGTIWMSPNAINSSTEVYVNSSDNWGKRISTNQFVKKAGAYEYMYKRKIETGQIAYMFHHEYKEIIAELKKRGITHIGGRPIEQIVLAPGTSVPAMPGTPEFEEIGMVGTSGPTLGSLGGAIGTAGGVAA